MTAQEPPDKAAARLGKASISERQNDPDNLRVLMAARQRHEDAKRLHAARALGTLLLAALSPVVAFMVPQSAIYLGAAGGAWVLLARAFLLGAEQRAIRDGAVLQEQFDCQVFGIPWNRALGRHYPDEDLIATARRWKDVSKLRDWYPSVSGLTFPFDVLVCQRSSAVWGRRLHREYAVVVGSLTGLWLMTGIVISLLTQTSLATYLLAIFLPSQAALLDGIDVVRAHRNASRSKAAIEAAADLAIEASHTAVRTPSLLRLLQDRIFQVRADAPIVSELWYRWRRKTYEADMEEAANQLARRLADSGERVVDVASD